MVYVAAQKRFVLNCKYNSHVKEDSQVYHRETSDQLNSVKTKSFEYVSQKYIPLGTGRQKDKNVFKTSVLSVFATSIGENKCEKGDYWSVDCMIQ